MRGGVGCAARVRALDGDAVVARLAVLDRQPLPVLPRRLADHRPGGHVPRLERGVALAARLFRLRLEARLALLGGDVRHVPVDLVDAARGLDDLGRAHLPDGHERLDDVQRLEAGREATAHPPVVDRDLPVTAPCLYDLNLPARHSMPRSIHTPLERVRVGLTANWQGERGAR